MVFLLLLHQSVDPPSTRIVTMAENYVGNELT